MTAGHVPDAGADHPLAADGHAFNGEVGRGLAELLLRVIAAQPGVTTICDLGCGNGYLCGELGRRGHSVLGVDASPTYLEFAATHHGSERVRFVRGHVDDTLTSRLLASHGPFDLVVSSDVIEHLYDPLQLLTTAAGLLRAGGTAVIGTPYHGYLKNLAIGVTGQWDSHHGVHWHGGHIKFFSVASLGAMMREAGFSTPHFDYYGRFPGFWRNMIAVARKPDGATVESNSAPNL